MQETWVSSLILKDPLDNEVSTHASILAWEIPWTEEPGRLQSMGIQRVRHDSNYSKNHNLNHSFHGLLFGEQEK